MESRSNILLFLKIILRVFVVILFLHIFAADYNKWDMKKYWKEFLYWFAMSNRYQHYLLGTVIGLGAESLYSSLYVGAGVGGALEFKDYQWKGKPDIIDFSLTVAGVVTGYILKVLTLKCIGYE